MFKTFLLQELASVTYILLNQKTLRICVYEREIFFSNLYVKNKNASVFFIF